jgi:hypothetical protein
MLLFVISNDDQFALFQSKHYRITDLEVKGQKVTVIIEAPAEEFDSFVKEAQRVLTTVEFSQS